MMAGYEIRFYPERCVGCQACVVACMDEKDIDPTLGEQPICRIFEQEAEAEEKILLAWNRKSCRHCDYPSCIDICPGGGFWKDEATGMVLYDKTRCVSCGQCIDACEEHAISFDRNRVIQKCDGCRDRILNGQQPSCVSVCPWGALELTKSHEVC